MHTFHLSCGKCTFTSENMQLWLGLPVDGSKVTRIVHVDWRAVCEELLELVSETIFGGRIEMAWLRRNFHKLDEDSIEIEREQHTHSYILLIIGGILMLDKS